MSMKKIGVAGGNGGNPFENFQIPEGAKIREIRLLADRYVNALQIIYTDAKGKIGELQPVGGINGQLKTFTLNPGERLTGISGTCGWYIDSLRFHTNKRTSAEYGISSGANNFEFKAPRGEEVVGFYGHADWYIDQIGVVTRKSKTEAAPRAAAPKSPTKPKAKTGKKKKDLTLIEGVGPKLAEVLKDAGIPDFVTLAKTEVAHLKKIIDNAGRRFNLADPTTWPEQAALAAREAWEALEQLQDKLKGGRHG